MLFDWSQWKLEQLWGTPFLKGRVASDKQYPAFCDVGTVTPGVPRVPVAVGKTLALCMDLSGSCLNSCLYFKTVSHLEEQHLH